MTSRARIAAYTGGAVAGLIVLAIGTALVIAQTVWFQDFVRRKIVAVVEESTGGRVALSSFTFDLHGLRATLRGFSVRGTEPAGAAPLLMTEQVVVQLKLFSGLKQAVDLQSLTIDRPQVNLIVGPDGTTNIPSPKIKKKPGAQSPLETVLDLAVGHFELRNGLLTYNDRKTPLNARGENVSANLSYNRMTPQYEGRVSISPLHLTYAGNQPLDIRIAVPVTIGKDRINFSDARIGTELSELSFSGQVENMQSPKVSARVNGKLSLADARRFANLPISKEAGGKLPGTLDLDLSVTADENSVQVQNARLTLGQSSLVAAGMLRDPNGQGGLQFKTTVNLGEASRLFQVAAQPEGVAQVEGTAKLHGSDYEVDGNVNGRNLSFRQGTTRIRGVNVATAFHADPHIIGLKEMQLSAFGGAFTGGAELEDLTQLALHGRLDHLDLQAAAGAFLKEKLPYDGVVSGPVRAEGNLKARGASGIRANMRLVIAPGKGKVPVTGRINAEYTGATDSVQLVDSYVALPNTRLQLSGALGRQIQFEITSRNLDDFLPVATLGSSNPLRQMPVVLRSPMKFQGAISGTVSNPQVTGHLSAGAFLAEGRRFDSLAADLELSSNAAAVRNATLTRGAMHAGAEASLGLTKWKPLPRSPLAVRVALRNGDLADIMALAGRADIPMAGALTADADVSGTFGNPTGVATMVVVNGSAYQEPFDLLDARVNFSDQLISLPAMTLTSGPSRIELNATFRHPPDTFSTGHVEARIKSNDVQLGRLQNAAKPRPALTGILTLNAETAGDLAQRGGDAEFQLARLNADLRIRGLKAEGQDFGDLTGSARTDGATVRYRLDSGSSSSTIRVNGETRLEPQYPTTASASIRDLPIESLLALAGRKDIPAVGNLAASANVNGTLNKLSGSAEVTLRNAALYQEPIDRVTVHASLSPETINVSLLEVTAGPSRLNLTASYHHQTDDLERGEVMFHMSDSRVQLGRIRNIQQTRPGLTGLVEISADGAASVQPSTAGGAPQVLFSRLNANVNAPSVIMNKADLGKLSLTAKTRGEALDFSLDSGIGGAQVRGSGQVTLRGDYPMNAQLNISNATYSGLVPLLTPGSSVPPDWDAYLDGKVTISGPAARPEALNGTADFSRAEWKARTGPGTSAREVAIRNEGPVVAVLENSVLRIRSARFVGPNTTIQLAGFAPLRGPKPMDMNVSANADLGVVQQVSRSIYSSGTVALGATIRGTMAQPLINGRVELKNASFNHIDSPNGLSNANGTIVFNGNSANIQQLTAESGGGKITMSGFAGYTRGALTYNVRANGREVRLRTAGLSVVSNANVTLTGNTERSLLSGTVTVQNLSFSPRHDFGSMLSRTAQPVQSAHAASGPIDGMRLDVRIRSAVGAMFQTSLAEGLQADASLNVRGTLMSPGVVGRVNVTSGKLVFFGTEYTINRGTVSFYNPLRIEPVLDVGLITTAKGVNVTLNVSGPIDNMRLTYTSDPPLQFSEVVSLLATGHTPTSDPNLLAREPAAPPQSLQQMGQSALLTQAVANPVANRLQRVFGINKLKIDPTFTSGSQLPQARLTLQQQVTSNLTFTYITNLAQTNSQIVRVEWALNDTWSAIATREEDGLVGVDLFYKLQLR
ncbi:MAG: translocation/assembly module TamB domain-containing protein [Bryobacteraceae bacterium]